MAEENRQQHSPLRILSWNVNGFRARKPEIQELIDCYQPDVVAIQETRLRDNNALAFQRYEAYRKERPTAHGGVALLVKRTIEHHLTNDADGINDAVTVEVTHHNRKYRITSLYRPPGPPVDPEIFGALLTGPGARIAIGDLNCKSPAWHNTIEDRAGRDLLDIVDNLAGVVIGPEYPTFIPTNDGRPSVLDVAILKNITDEFEMETLNEGSSDHNPILLKIGSGRPSDDTQVSKKTNWNSFKSQVEERIPSIPRIETTMELEQAVEDLEEAIIQAHRDCTTFTTEPVPRSTFGPLPAQIRQLITQNRRLKRQHLRQLTEESRVARNRASQALKNALKELSNRRWNQRMAEIETEDGTAWQMQKKLRRRHTPLPPIHGQRGMAFTDREKAEAFADTLQTECRENLHPDEDDEHLDEIEDSAEELRDLQTTNETDTPTNPAEVWAIIRRTKTRKAPGKDGINNKMLKNLPKKAVVALANVANACLRLDHFPRRWKEASVMMLTKAGKDRTFPQNYRPISLLSSVGKVVERIVASRIQDRTRQLGIIPNEQFGFRSMHNTELQALRMTEYITSGINNREATGLVLLDVERAFDRVWHDGLVVKMRTAGFEDKTCKLVQSYLEDRKFTVKVGKQRSTLRTLEAGVPQGSALAPLLYSIFTHDVPKTQQTALALYADDTAIAAKARNTLTVNRRLQEELDQIQDWSIKWKIKVNSQKTQAILLQKRRLPTPARLTLDGVEIPWLDQVKYLGVTFDKALTWKPHIDSVVLKAKAAMAQLYPMMKSPQLAMKTKLRLIKAIARPQLTYASAAWGYAAPSHRKKLAATEMRQLRIAIGAPWFVRNTNIIRDLEWETVHEFMRRKAVKTFHKAETHVNEHLRTLMDYDPAEEQINRWAKYKRPKHQLLDENWLF